MEECKPSSDAEETLVENGSASPPEDKIRGTFDSQNKGTTNISEEIPILEGAVPPEHDNFIPDSECKKNEEESKEKEEDEEKKHIEVNSVEKETDHEESKEVVPDRGDKGNEDESDKKEVDDEKKHTEKTAVAKEMDNEESKEGEKIEASDTMEEESKIEETNEENRIEETSAVSKENDMEQTKDDKETRDTNVSTEDVKMVDEEGDKGEEGETTDMVKPNDIKELKEDKMTDVVSTVKSEDVNVADVEGDKVMPLEDVKMVETRVGESVEPYSTKAKMLGIFQNTVAQAPEELHSPAIPPSPGATLRQPKKPDAILKDFHAAYSGHSFSASFAAGAALAFVSVHSPRTSSHPRLFCSFDDVYCMFVGSLNNLSSLIRQYGLCSKSTNEALLVIEAYRTLRDRGPYPADQVVKDLSGSFAFVVYDNKAGTVFAALSSDGGVPLFWGIAADGSVVICDDLDVVKASCGKSYAPFPTGCMFHSEGGLRSFEHPLNKLKAMPRVDSEGVMCGASFKVDTYSRINSMPRVGSAADWTSWEGS